MAAHVIPAAVLQRIRDRKAVVVVGPGLAGPPWGAEVARLIAELEGDYRVEVVGAAAAGGDATDAPAAERATIAWLEALREACRAQRVRPDAGGDADDAVADDPDDLEGWLGRLSDAGEDGAAARAALDQIEQAARAAGAWPRVIEVLMGRIEHAGDGPARARMLREVAEIYETDLGDLRRALAAIITACHMAPGDDDAAGAAERLASVTGGWAELVREASRLASEVEEPRLGGRWWTRVGRWYATRLGDLEAAMQAYEAAVTADAGAVAALEALVELYGETGSTDDHRRAMARLEAAVEQDPDNLAAALGLAGALAAEAEAAEGGAAVAIWRDADRRYREVLARHRGALSGAQITEIWARLGGIARALGDARAADAAFRRVVERDPLHGAARDGLVGLAEARGDWRAVAELKRAEIDALAGGADTAARRAKLYEQIGDVWRDRLADIGSAISAYHQGLALAPGSRGLLHKLLEAFTAQRAWRRAIEMLERLVAEEASPERRARFHYAAAVIARDELDDGALAADKLVAALDDAPLTAGAFDALAALLTARGDWKPLVRAYRAQLKRLGDADPEPLHELWGRLGDVCLDQLGDREAAIAAYQVACELEPGDTVHREQLAELYLAGGDTRRGEAIAALQALLGHAPGRVELYKALAGLYLAERELDKAWCVAQVLVVLGAASDDEARLYARFRGRPAPAAPRRLTEELWQQLAHPDEDRRVGAVLALAGDALALATAQPIAAFGLAAEARVELERDPPAWGRGVAYAAAVLAIDPAPMVWLDGGDGIRVANTLGLGPGPGTGGGADRPRRLPSLLVGEAALGQASDRARAFAVGKRLAYVRPERFAAVAAATLPALEAAVAAVRLAGGPAGPGDPAQGTGQGTGQTTDEVRALAAQLRAQVPGPVLAQIGELAAGLADRGPGLVAGWRAATDLTANRAGLVVADDLEAAARGIATEGATLSTLSVKARLRDLLGYAASEPYFAVRRHLGQHVPG